MQPMSEWHKRRRMESLIFMVGTYVVILASMVVVLAVTLIRVQ